jgi:hypothetical protein
MDVILGGVGVLHAMAKREPAPRPWPVLTLAHGQPLEEQHRRCRRVGPGCGAAGQHDAGDAGVRQGHVDLCDIEKTCCDCPFCLQSHAPCLHLCMCSLSCSRIGEAGVRELLTALQFNKTLAELK